MNPKSKKITPRELKWIDTIKAVKLLRSKGLTDEEIYEASIVFWNFYRGETFRDMEEIISEVYNDSTAITK